MMLVEFKIGNCLSFKDVVTFSMVAATIKEHQDSHVFKTKNFPLLKNAVMYGANASGKTNLMKALAFMRTFVINSAKESQAEERIEVNPFKLSTETEGKPSFFEITFIHEDIGYRYGFEVDQKCVHHEWLYFTRVRETVLFDRVGEAIEIGRGFRKEGKGLEAKTRKNALFLSVAAQWNGTIASKILMWFTNNLNVVSGLNDIGTISTLKLLQEKNDVNEMVLEFLKVADLGIDGVKVEETDVGVEDIVKINFFKNFPMKLKSPSKESLQNMASEVQFKKLEVITFHNKYSKEGNVVAVEKFDMDHEESAGTKKLFSLIGLVIDTITNGKVLIIDELDAKLHPLITLSIIRFFNSSDKNPNNAQLIFNTHDTSFLDKRLFRRDQIWFTEKNRRGVTDLYSLVEYDFKVRKDESFGKNYIIGKYGAIPYLGDLEDFSFTAKKENHEPQE
jgi:uncharacterized protein